MQGSRDILGLIQNIFFNTATDYHSSKNLSHQKGGPTTNHTIWITTGQPRNLIHENPTRTTPSLKPSPTCISWTAFEKACANFS